MKLFATASPNRFDDLQLREGTRLDPGFERSNVESAVIAAAASGRPNGPLTGLLGDKRRLVAEVRAMQERYGDVAVLRRLRKLLFWEYTVIESGRRFPIQVRYPRRYPLDPPRIFSRLPLPRSPHQLVENELCWTDRALQLEWNPARDTAVVCIHAAHRWFACLLVFLTLGEWPEGASDWPAHPA